MAKIFGTLGWPTSANAERAIRDKRHKVWVNPQRNITALYDLEVDPFEENNLIDSTKPEHVAAIHKYQAVVASLPKVDTRPCHAPRATNSWDVKLDKFQRSKKSKEAGKREKRRQQ